MTATPLATIAEALIEFILSLLRDPRLAAEFEADPDATLARAGLSDASAADVRSVMPVVVDHPDVVVKHVQVPVHVPVQVPAQVPYKAVPQPAPHQQTTVKDPEVVKHIQNVSNTYTIDNRSTIVDQSVNQNIWAEGDVMQIFDQEAVLAVGDHAVAAGDNALLDESTTDLSVGDVAIGNTDTDLTVTDSFNDSSTTEVAEVQTEVEDSYNDQSTTTQVEAEIETAPDSYAVIEVEAEPLPEFDYDNA